MTASQPHRPAFLQRRLQYLLLLRLLAVAAQVLALLLMAGPFGISLPWLPLALILAGLLVYTGLAWQHAPETSASSDAAIFRQLLVDIVALSALVYYSGGPANPFIALFLLPITFAAASLRPRHAWPLAGLAVLAYTLLMFFHRPVLAPHHDHGENFALHLWGMWYGFIISAALLVYFVGRIGHALRERDRQLAIARENALRADQLIALGTLATGTAHELGTPLSTMAVVVADMEADPVRNGDPETRDNLHCLREQISCCKQVLARLASDAGQLQADTGQAQPLDGYLAGVVDEWRALRPGIELHSRWLGRHPAPRLIADRTLTQALLNVLNNAADADARHIRLVACWSGERLLARISDDGSGLPAAARARLGVEPYSSKTGGDGLGLGLFLARTTLQRFGGHLDIDDSASGGARVDIDLPLQALLVE